MPGLHPPAKYYAQFGSYDFQSNDGRYANSHQLKQNDAGCSDFLMAIHVF